MKGVEPAREPCLTPTVPPPDQDARWIYASGNPLQQVPALPGAQAQGQGPLAESQPNATAGGITVDVIPLSPERLAEGGGGGKGTGNTSGAGEARAGSTKRNCEGSDASGVVDFFPVERQAPSSGFVRGGERNMRRCSSVGEARTRPRNRISHNHLLTRGNQGRSGGYGQPLRTPWHPLPVAKEQKERAGLGFGSRGGLFLSPSITSVSPWCRQSPLPSEWTPAGGQPDGQVRGAMGWTDDASGSSA